MISSGLVKLVQASPHINGLIVPFGSLFSLYRFTLYAPEPVSLLPSLLPLFLASIFPVTFNLSLKTSSELRTRQPSLVMALSEGLRGCTMSQVHEHQRLAFATSILAVQRPVLHVFCFSVLCQRVEVLR